MSTLEFEKSRSLLNASLSAVSKSLNLLVSLVSTLVALLVFDDDAKDIFFLTGSLLALIASAEAGITLAATVSITRCLGEVSDFNKKYFFLMIKSKTDLARMMRLYFSLYIILAFSMAVFLGFYFSVSIENYTGIPVFLVLASVPIIYMSLYLQVVFDATGRLYLHQRSVSVATVIGFLGFCLCAYYDYPSAALAVFYFTRALLIILFDLSMQPIPLDVFGVSLKSIGQLKSILDKFQWRLSGSWLAGSAMFYSMVPIYALASDGSDLVAIGIFVQVFHAILGLGLVWQIGAQPFFVERALHNKRSEVMDFVRRISMKCCLTGACLVTLILLAAHFLPEINGILLKDSSTDIFCVGLATCALLWASPRTAMLRATRNEPFLELSMLIAASVIGVSYFSGIILRNDILIYGFSGLMVLQALVIEAIYAKSLKLWFIP